MESNIQAGRVSSKVKPRPRFSPRPRPRPDLSNAN